MGMSVDRLRRIAAATVAALSTAAAWSATAGAVPNGFQGCAGSDFQYLRQFSFPVAAKGFADDCMVTMGDAQIDARTGTPTIGIGVGDGVGVDARGRLIVLGVISGPILVPTHPVGVIGSVSDSTGGHWTLSYDSAGRVTMVSGTSGTTTLTYDSADNLTQSSASGQTFGYDAARRLTSFSDIGGDTGAFSYNASGRLASANLVFTSADPTETFTYDTSGNVLTWTTAAGIVSTTLAYAHNSSGDVTTVQKGLGIDATLTYAAAHRLSSVLDSVSSPIATFTYDGAGRLITAQGTSPSATTIFAYDSAGRLASTTNSSMTNTFAYDGLGRVVSIKTPIGATTTIGYLPAPTATTLGSSHLRANAATVSGTVNPLGAPTSFQFEFGRTTAYGHTTTVGKLTAGNSPVSVSGRLSGLKPATTYHYRLLATNHDGSGVGRDRTFRTAALVCRVPHLAGDTLKAAQRALAKSHCRLGHVRRPHLVPRHAKLTVTAQHPSPGSVRRAGAAVKVTLTVS